MRKRRKIRNFRTLFDLYVFRRGVVKRKRHVSSAVVAPLKWIKKPYLENGGHAVPDIKEK